MTEVARFQAIIFDMDGVLIDSEPRYFRAVNALLEEHGVALTDEEYFGLIGTTGRHTWQWIMDRFRLPHPYETWRDRYDKVVLEVLAEPAEPLPGVRELIEVAARRGLPIGLASSSRLSWIQAILRGLGLSDTFNAIVHGGMVEHGKPAPDIFLLTAERLGVPPEACVVIEDSQPGVQAANAAGMFTVQLRATAHAAAPLPQADLVLESLEDFPLSLLDGRAAAL